MPAGKGKPVGGYRAGAKGSYGCEGYPTVSADGTVHGCHPTKAKASAQARAIWASTAKKFISIIEKSMPAEGDFVIASCEDEIHVGIIQYVMTDGMFGIKNSDYSLEASVEEPVVLVRILELEEDYGWDETEYLIGVKSSMVTKIEPLFIPDLQNNEAMNPEVAMAMYDSSIGKAKKPNYQDMIKPRRGGSNPADSQLYARVVQAAKDKFDVYPSAVANAWVVQEYKRRGGTYKSDSVSKNSVWGGSLFDPKGFLK
jgi:hypothetical protein